MGEAKRTSERRYDMVMFTIGDREDLTPGMCEKAAVAWRTITAENPKASFELNIVGYDDDPRELWEFLDVCAYVQRWAKLVGLDDIEEADRWVGSGIGLALLAACGVFGDEMRRESLSDLDPTTEH
jgi:hypothetical protein